MVSPHTPTSSNSSALFGSDDTTFLEALAGAVLPGDLTPQASNAEETVTNLLSDPFVSVEASGFSLEPPPCAQLPSNSSDIQSRLEHSPLVPSEPFLPQLESPTPAQSRYKKRACSISSGDEHPALAHSPPNTPIRIASSYLDSNTYGASRFGEFGEYMRRKRAKLQIQNAEMGDTPGPIPSKSKLFNGLSIHVGQLFPILWVDGLRAVRSTVGQSPLSRSCVK